MSAIEGPVRLLTGQRRQPRPHPDVTERLYECPNGLSLGAIRDGVLTLGDDDRPWEIFAIDQIGIPYGGTRGFVTDEVLDQAVTRLRAWPV